MSTKCPQGLLAVALAGVVALISAIARAADTTRFAIPQ